MTLLTCVPGGPDPFRDDPESTDYQAIPWDLLSGHLLVRQATLDGSLLILDGDEDRIDRFFAGRTLQTPALSRDRQRVAYTFVHPLLGEGIWAIPVTEMREVCHPASPTCGVPLFDETDINERGPAWSPGGRLAYFRAGRFYVDGQLAHDEGSLEQCCRGRTPGWAPDGSLIAYLDHATPGLYRIDPVTKGIELMFENPVEGTWFGSPTVSPDGTRLAYTRYFPAQTAEIWVSGIDGSDARLLAEGTRPTWAPDGALLAYDGGSGVYVVDPDVGESIFVIIGSHPSWQP